MILIETYRSDYVNSLLEMREVLDNNLCQAKLVSQSSTTFHHSLQVPMEEDLEVDCGRLASEKLDAVEEKTSEVVEKVKGETEEETDCRMLVTFSLLGAWGSGYLAHVEVNAAVLLGGDNS